MSYNPAFVSDELATGSSARPGSEHDQSNGIKLTSFKILPVASQNVVLELGAGSERPESNASNSCSNRDKQPRDRRAAGSGANPKSTGAHKAKRAARASQSANQAVVSGQPAKTGQSQLCQSASSSLTLIDNPTLNSLTPSASSYATTTSSILSSGSTDSTKTNSTSTSNSTTAGQHTPIHAAVECRDMRYDVGRGANQKTILYNINVTVPEGSIYGLLGPSGCGKTTMLRCVVGRIKPKEGSVRVFGYKPNDSGSQIPGPAIGYMPQVSTCFPAWLVCSPYRSIWFAFAYCQSNSRRLRTDLDLPPQLKLADLLCFAPQLPALPPPPPPPPPPQQQQQ